MVEATNFVEKTLGKSLDPEKNPEIISENKKEIPVYTPPQKIKEETFYNNSQEQYTQEPKIQIVEKIVYKKQRIHGFFRTLTIIALLAIGFLMLGESTWLITLSINSFKLHQIFPIVIIFSAIVIRSYKGIFGKIFWLILFLTVWWWMFTIWIYTGLNPSSTRKSIDNINYALPKIDATAKTGATTKTILYLETLIGNSYIKWSSKNTTIKGTRNSDRRLFASSGQNEDSAYIKFHEDTNRNVLQNYFSKIDLLVPEKTTFDLFYIKNLLWIHTIDLNSFQWKMLKFHAGIDDITINIGNVLSGNKVEIQGTAANVKLNIPKDVWVIMYYKHFVGMLDTPEFDVLSGHYFQSQNLDTAKTTLNLYINLAVGNTKINRIEAQK